MFALSAMVEPVKVPREESNNNGNEEEIRNGSLITIFVVVCRTSLKLKCNVWSETLLVKQWKNAFRKILNQFCKLIYWCMEQIILLKRKIDELRFVQKLFIRINLIADGKHDY